MKKNENNEIQENKGKNVLLSNTEKLINQKEQFTNMNQVAAETENVAIQITGNLKYQRDLLLTAETSVFLLIFSIISLIFSI